MGQQKGFTTWAPKQDSGVWAQTTWSSGPAHMGQKHDSAKQHAEGQKSHASPTAFASSMNQNCPQMRKEKKVSSLMPINFSSMRQKKSVV